MLGAAVPLTVTAGVRASCAVGSTARSGPAEPTPSSPETELTAGTSAAPAGWSPVADASTGDQPAGAADVPAVNSVSGAAGVGSAGPDRAGDPTAQDARTPAVTVRGTAATATRDVRLKIRRFLPEQDACLLYTSDAADE